MKAYKISGANESRYAGTLKKAHDDGKDLVAGGDDWRDIQIDEVEVPTDKDSIIRILNGWGDTKETGRVWELTPRLGLQEVGEKEKG